MALIGTKGMNWGPHVFGGFETAVTELGPRLAAAGCQVTIYCRRHLYRTEHLTESVRGVRLKYVGGIESKNLGTLTNGVLSVIDALRTGSDVIVLFNTGLGPLIPLIKVAGCRVLMHLDGMEWKREKWGWLARRVFEIGAGVSAQYADELIADAREIQRVYRERYGRGGEYIPYGARPPEEVRASLLQPFGLREGSYYLLVTRFVPENNPVLVIREFLRSHSNKSLVVLGGNFYDSAYERVIREIQDPRVILAGFIADQETLHAFYRYCYAYIHGHSAGGTNPTMLEALANSCCVLALDTPFTREMLCGTEFGLLWKREEGSLAQLLARVDGDTALVQRFRDAAMSRIRDEYNWDSVASRYVEVIDSVLRDRSVVAQAHASATEGNRREQGAETEGEVVGRVLQE